MRHKQMGKQNIASFHLKQHFISLLSGALEGCCFDIVLGFESSMRKRVCTLKFVNDRRIDVCLNLGYVKNHANFGSRSFTFSIRYCALFIAEYIKLIERARIDVPKNYFDGLVYLNAIEDYKTHERLSIYSPLLCLDRKTKRTHRVRPIEISSAINSLNKLRIFALPLLNERDIAAAKSLCNDFLLYSALPEVVYIRANVPAYAIVHSFKKLGELLASNPETAHEFPILNLAPFGQVEHLTTSDLFRICIQSDNAFLIGVAIRLIAFLHVSHDTEFDNGCQKKLVDAMKLYLEHSVAYCVESSQVSKGLLKDNSFAIREAVKSINEYLTASGIGLSTGNIHSVE